LKPYAEEKVSGNEGINRIEQWTYEQLQTLRSNIDGLTTQNRDRQYVEDRMTAMKSYLEAHKKRVNDTTNQFLVEKRAYDLQFDVIRAESAYESARQSKDAVYKHLQEARLEASELGYAMFGASEIHYAMVHLRDRLASLNNRIDDCEMEAKSPIKISIERRASDPVHPARSAGSMAFIASVLVGFGLVGGVCLGFEMLDGRVRSVRHVDGALGGRSPEALICRARQRDFGGWEGIANLWMEETAWARALRSLAVRLEGQRKGHGVRVVLVAGVSRESGATTVAANLAGALGKSVRRVLFVEAQPGRRVLQNEVKGIETSLDRALEDVSAWIESQVEGANVCALFASEGSGVTPAKMRELLTAAREVFDVVLVNTAPIGEDDLAQFVALEVDAAVIVAREDRAQYSDLLDALERLRARPVPALTAVLNGFGQRDASRLAGSFRICLGLLRKRLVTPLFRVFGGMSPT
jgi:Mrp family chromosome partitioning ATPase